MEIPQILFQTLAPRAPRAPRASSVARACPLGGRQRGHRPRSRSEASPQRRKPRRIIQPLKILDVYIYIYYIYMYIYIYIYMYIYIYI